MKKIIIVLLLLSLPFFSSCGHSATQGLKESSLENLQRENFEHLGISLLIPSSENREGHYFYKIFDSASYKKKSHTIGEMVMLYHPIYNKSPFTDPVYLLEISISRLSMDQFDEFLNGKHILNIDKCINRLPNFTEAFTINEIDSDRANRKYLCVRKDYNTINKDYLVISGKIILQDNFLLNVDENVILLKRMLNSLEEIK